jgi:hypothetical protein
MRVGSDPQGGFLIWSSVPELLYLRAAMVAYSTARNGSSIPMVDHIVGRLDDAMAVYARHKELVGDRQPSLLP